jgi:hypothetical protein
MDYIEALTKQSNLTTTENGALANYSSLDYCVDFFAMGGSMRTWSIENITDVFSKSYHTDPDITLKLMFMFRDIRQGQGLRQPFRYQLQWLANNYPLVLKPLIQYIPEYGRFDDLYMLVDTPLQDEAIHCLCKQIHQDVSDMNQGKPISLAGKWLKRINTSSPESRSRGHITRKHLKLSEQEYRKLCVTLNNYIDVTENKMSSNSWEQIMYETVPSQCLTRNYKSFIKYDKNRYNQFITKVKAGDARINTSTLYPHQVIKEIFKDQQSETAEQLWNNLPSLPVDNNAIVVADVSGSMTVDNSTPLYVSIALALYFSERATGVYKDKFITFSAIPRLEDLSGCNSILDKVRLLENAHWEMNTDVMAVFELVLEAAINNNIPSEDIVKTIYIISDMEFDAADKQDKQTIFEIVKQKFEAAGYKLPKLVFWNVASNKKQFPVIADTSESCMISGFSPNILKYFGDLSVMSPYNTMMDVVNNARYQIITA